MISFNGKFTLSSDVRCSDKSLTHRALIAAAIAEGTSSLRNVTLSRDVSATASALKAVANIDLQRNEKSCDCTAKIIPNENFRQDVTVNCLGSGTTARLVGGLFAGAGIRARFVGDDSLVKRPMDRLVRPLRQLGANIRCAKDCLFETEGGNLHGAHVLADAASAQVKSAVVFAGLFAEGETRYTELVPTRNHTELLLRELGADVTTDGKTVVVHKSRPHCFEMTLPNDPSAVAYSVALALISGQKATFVNVLLNERRLGFYRVLQRAGARINYRNVRTLFGESVGDVEVLPSKLRPFTSNAQDSCDGIDEIPLLAALAMLTEGTHIFENVGELVYKECDRIQAIGHIASVCGQRCAFDGGNLTIESDGKTSGGKFFHSFGDHRVAMSETVLCVACGGGAVDSAPFDVSHPDFLKSLGIAPMRFALVGSDVANSLSPRLHAFLAAQAGVCCSYDAVTLPPSVCDSELVATLGEYDGSNVTMPFKTRAASLLGSDMPSVNTVTNRGKRCFSTDGYGVTESLRRHGIAFEGQPLWIVGAGGAAEAVIRELTGYGCKLQVFNRTEERIRYLRRKYTLAEVSDPVGVLSFVPQCEFERSVVLPASCRFVLVADYKGDSGLRKQAEQRGIAVIDGLEMLFHQGAKSFALWTGTPVCTDYESFEKQVK